MHVGLEPGAGPRIMTVRGLCVSILHGDRGFTRVGGRFTRAPARVGRSPADTVGLASKVRGQACTL
jgi:hypothetical protein